MQKQRRYDGVVMGPDGNPLTLDDLPPAGTTRWVIRRKAEVVAAVRGGLLTLGRRVRALRALGRRVRRLA